jgi:hypothetical protein
MERRALLLVLAAAVLGLALYAIRHRNAPRQHNIGRMSFNQIEEGMTQEQVEALLGVPPGDYSKSIQAVRGNRFGSLGARRQGYRQEEWWSDWGIIRVAFRPDGVVAGKEFLDVDVKDKSWLGTVMDKLGL